MPWQLSAGPPALEFSAAFWHNAAMSYGLDPELPPSKHRRADPAPGLVESGVLCARCGYDLGGLKENQRCPECAGPIVNSLRAELLEFAAPEFLKRLHRGAMLVQISAISATVGVAGLVLAVILLITLAAAGVDPVAIFIVMGVLGVAGPLACGATGVAGWWMLTARDPGAGGVRKDARVRKVLRIGVIVAGACWMCVCVPPVAGALMDLPPAVYVPLTIIVGVGLLVSTLTVVFASAPFLAYLGRRLEDGHTVEMAATQTKIAAAAAGAIALLVLVLTIQVPVPGVVIMVPGLIVTLMVYHARLMNRVRLLLDDAKEGNLAPVYNPTTVPRSNDPRYR